MILRGDSGRGHRCGSSWCRSRGSDRGALSIDISLWALARNVSSLAAAVACLSSSVEWSAIRSGAIAGNVSELSACIALHSLSLAVTGKVIRPAALVASSWASTAGKAATESTKATTGSTSAPTCAGGTGVGACTLQGLR